MFLWCQQSKIKSSSKTKTSARKLFLLTDLHGGIWTIEIADTHMESSIQHMMLHAPSSKFIQDFLHRRSGSYRIFFINGPTSASFSFIFGLFKQTIQFSQQINVKKLHVHPVSGAGIRTHDLWNVSRIGQFNACIKHAQIENSLYYCVNACDLRRSSERAIATLK